MYTAVSRVCGGGGGGLSTRGDWENSVPNMCLVACSHVFGRNRPIIFVRGGGAHHMLGRGISSRGPVCCFREVCSSDGPSPGAGPTAAGRTLSEWSPWWPAPLGDGPTGRSALGRGSGDIQTGEATQGKKMEQLINRKMALGIKATQIYKSIEEARLQKEVSQNWEIWVETNTLLPLIFHSFL